MAQHYFLELTAPGSYVAPGNSPGKDSFPGERFVSPGKIRAPLSSPIYARNRGANTRMKCMAGQQHLRGGGEEGHNMHARGMVHAHATFAACTRDSSKQASKQQASKQAASSSSKQQAASSKQQAASSKQQQQHAASSSMPQAAAIRNSKQSAAASSKQQHAASSSK